MQYLPKVEASKFWYLVHCPGTQTFSRVESRLVRDREKLLFPGYRVLKCDVIILQTFPFEPLNLIVRYTQLL